jgi:hypothetical protein
MIPGSFRDLSEIEGNLQQTIRIVANRPRLVVIRTLVEFECIAWRGLVLPGET